MEDTTKLKKCPYSGGDARVSLHEDRNYIGVLGYVCTIRCGSCSREISIWSIDPKIAEERARRYWNGEA